MALLNVAVINGPNDWDMFLSLRGTLSCVYFVISDDIKRADPSRLFNPEVNKLWHDVFPENVREKLVGIKINSLRREGESTWIIMGETEDRLIFCSTYDIQKRSGEATINNEKQK